MADPTPSKSLWELARAYTAGQMSPDEATAFEGHLAVNQEAREALVAAVQQQWGADSDAVRPNPEYRAAVLHRLTPHPLWTWVRRLLGPTTPRTTWTLAGAALALMLLLTGWMLVPSTPCPEVVPVVQPAPTPPAEPLVQQPVAAEKVTVPWQERAKDHLVKVPEDDAARKLKHGVTRTGAGRDLPMVP